MSRHLYLTRVYSFCASHHLSSPYLSSEENISLYGKCGQKAGHGHNYTLKITVKGCPDPETGMLADLSKIDAIVKESVLKRLDHANLNLLQGDMEILTSENLTKDIWRYLSPFLASPQLYKIELNETSKNGFKYMGDELPSPTDLS